MTLIPASPGWRVLVWERSNGEALTLPIVAWEEDSIVYASKGSPDHFLRPWVQTAYGEEVSPFDFEGTTSLFVAILAPRDKRSQWEEQAIQVGKAAEEADEREERKLREAAS